MGARYTPISPDLHHWLNKKSIFIMKIIFHEIFHEVPVMYYTFIKTGMSFADTWQESVIWQESIIKRFH